MEITAIQLKERIDKKDRFVLIDVREPYEYEEFNLGGKLIPLGEVADSFDQFEKEDDIVLHCAGGKKSAVALMLFENAGFTNVSHLEGGVKAWIKEFGDTLS